MVLHVVYKDKFCFPALYIIQSCKPLFLTLGDILNSAANLFRRLKCHFISQKSLEKRVGLQWFCINTLWLRLHETLLREISFFY